MYKENILIVDDEKEMRDLIRIHLAQHFEVIEAKNGQEAVEIVKEETVSLILLDLLMPDMDGREVCRQIRKRDEMVPIIMLTALGETRQKVEGLNMGADDYIVKPFDPDELIARVKAHLRRSSQMTKENERNTDALNYGALKVIPDAREVFVNSKTVKLTPKEYDLLYLLASNEKRVFTREHLLNEIWGMDEVLDVRTVDSHVKNVRMKLKKSGLSFNPIQTVWGVGYKFHIHDERS